VDASSLSLRSVEWLERGQIPASALTLLAGMGGKGKSTLAAGYAALASRGHFDGKYAGQAVTVLWVGNEDGREDVIGPRLRAAGADFGRVKFLTLDSESLSDDINIVGDIDGLRQIVVQHEVKLIVVDPVVEYLPAATDSHNDMSVRHALRPLRNLAIELGIAIIGLVHLNKGDTLDVAARITGSGAFRNVARSVLVVAEYPDEEGWRAVFQNKSNIGPEDGRGRLYRIEGAQYTDLQDRPVLDSEGNPATTGKVVWGTWVELDPYSLPARDREREAPRRDAAKEMLTTLLREGPKLRSYIKGQAEREKIGWHTVERAKTELGVEDRQIPVPGQRGPGPSWWGLPSAEWSAKSCVPSGGGPLEPPETLTPEGDSTSPNEWSATSPEAQKEVAGLSDDARPHVANNSGDNEWYTPAEYVQAARTAMGGIDLDPASCSEANKVVEASVFWTADDNGLEHPWSGRVWMNPPYARGLVDKFCTKLVERYQAGDVTQACVMVNNATDTGWFHALSKEASAMCFLRGRVRFWHPDKQTSTPLQGQAVVYLGNQIERFSAEFQPFGRVQVPARSAWGAEVLARAAEDADYEPVPDDELFTDLD